MPVQLCLQAAGHFFAAGVTVRQTLGQVPLHGAQRPILQFSKVAAEFHPHRDPDDGRHTVRCKESLLPGCQSAPYSAQESAVSFPVRVHYLNSPDSFP